jgi:hypothetical protein
MGNILSSRRDEEGVLLEVKARYEEYLRLQGHMDDIHLFSEKEGVLRAHVSERGRDGRTKYFLIPRELRKGFRPDNTIRCGRIDKEDKILFVYVVDKASVAPSRRAITAEKYATQEV